MLKFPELFFKRSPVAEINFMISGLGYAVCGAQTEHDVLGGALHGEYLLALVDYHRIAVDGGDVFFKAAHIAVTQVAHAGVCPRAEAHVVVKLPVFKIVARLVARHGEV